MHRSVNNFSQKGQHQHNFDWRRWKGKGSPDFGQLPDQALRSPACGLAESHLALILEETKCRGEVVTRHSHNEKVQGGKRGKGASLEMLTSIDSEESVERTVWD